MNLGEHEQNRKLLSRFPLLCTINQSSKSALEGYLWRIQAGTVKVCLPGTRVDMEDLVLRLSSLKITNR